ncbi:hypothetical protein WA1_42670 [Scytonema hofmannii PCC 7110]|uniref:Uncharacterized protein n=1 Tax=Scytonema hofmannii PCC 7110 TaxID=128403 RepID=A0A139WVJ0_9CYAN|nr:hypothetical protein [Scytonema hofmannii]KYC36413.1 hypothetical protein WA1_42670 [Scytonema hofmannii PCC 7110]
MKYSQLKVIKTLEQPARIVGIVGILGILGFMVGQICLLTGATERIAIEMEKTLKPHERLLRKAIGVGGVSIVSGIIFIGNSRKPRQEKAESEIYSSSVFTNAIATPRACEGCKHYHGTVYNGVPFVCAMYPYGVEKDVCPDWEKNNS